MSNSFRFLGTGASLGVPVIGCSCAVCRSDNVNNKRLRPAALVTFNGKRLLLDCGPDLRQQFLQYHIDYIDGLLITHAHYDHVEGLDELRAFTLAYGEALPTVMSRSTYTEMESRFRYIFHNDNPKIITTGLSVTLLEGDRGIVNCVGSDIRYFTYEQAGMEVQGFRFNDLAYVSDIKRYPETIFKDLQGVETLILSALRYGESVMHFTVDEAVAFAEKVGAKMTYLTHISHDIDNDTVNAALPSHVRLGYDGQEIAFA